LLNNLLKFLYVLKLCLNFAKKLGEFYWISKTLLKFYFLKLAK
jgi:hypothetical protein